MNRMALWVAMPSILREALLVGGPGEGLPSTGKASVSEKGSKFYKEFYDSRTVWVQ